MNFATIVVTSTLALSPDALTLDEVLRSVDDTHPLLFAAQSEIDVARGKLTSARGAFDTYLSAKGGGYAAGFYDGVVTSAEVRQPTTLWGAELYAGHRYGSDHPIYDAKKTTSTAGEIAAGLMVPLWRDGPTDQRRVAIAQAELGIDVSRLEARAKILSTKQKAAAVYWKWVAATENLQIAAEVLKLAETRAKWLSERVARGDVAAIELVDNERLIVARLELVAEARREVQARALALSLFVRDAEGIPIIPGIRRAPGGLPEPSAPLPFDNGVIEEAFLERPELRQFEALKRQLRRDVDLYENQLAPRVDLSIEGSQDLGDKISYGGQPDQTTKNETAVGLQLALKWPVQQRKARGKLASTNAKLRAVDAKARFMRDAIETEIRDAWSAYEISRTRVTLTRRTLELTRTVEESERERFRLGASSILQVNLREDASAKAAKDVVKALADHHIAAAWFKAATAKF